MKKKGLLLCLALLSGLSLVSCAKDRHTPEITIGENGNWFIDGEDQGVPAQGEKGDTGISIVSVTKGVSIGNTDTYIVNYSDGTTSSFTVTNGRDGEDADDLTVKNVSIKSSTNNVDTYEIEFSDGYKTTFTVTNGTDGKNLSVISINKESTDGLCDTYKISFSDESYQTFIVKNGKDGLTPYIGDNGNWWIGDEDTGVLADYEKANNVPLTIYSSGLIYTATTVGNKSGFVVSGYNENLVVDYLEAMYGDEYVDDMYDDQANGHLVIPNYIGAVPVIGIADDVHLNFGKITFSKNTVFLGNGVFYNCSNVKEIDFNECELTYISSQCFQGTSIKEITLPDTVTTLLDSALNSSKILVYDSKDSNLDASKIIKRINEDLLMLSYQTDPNKIEKLKSITKEDYQNLLKCSNVNKEELLKIEKRITDMFIITK
ncbi:MAG: leucine-rich repeat protein [Acholeplasmatales bacterium]|nr:leucine-rich repeat protein [Acholeplasmatales bacterium]